MIRPSSVLLLLLVLASLTAAALWWNGAPTPVRPVTIVTPSSSPRPEPPAPVPGPVLEPQGAAAPSANPLLAVAPAQGATDAEKQIELLQGQVEYLHDQVKALQQENSELIDKLAKLGMKNGGPMKAEPVPAEAAPDDLVGLGSELLTLRELQELPQPTVTVPQAKVEEIILAWLRRQYSGDFGQREGAALAALGVIPKAVDTLPLKAGFLVRQLGGWYDEQAETIFIVDPEQMADGVPVQSDPVLGVAYATLLHHFQKALMPEALEKLTTDERMARLGLIGGDATLIRFLRDLKKFQGPDPDAIPAEDPDHPLNQVPMPAYLRELELFPAVHGFHFAQAMHSIGGFSQLAAAYGKSPDSTADLLDPQHYLDEQRLPVPRIEWKSVEVQSAKPFWDDRLGQFAALAFLKRYNEPQLAIDATRGWQSDRFLAYSAGEGKRGHSVWQTRWNTPEQAALFLKALRESLSQFYDAAPDAESFAAGERRVSSLLLPDRHSVLVIDAEGESFARAAEGVFRPAAK